MFRVFFLSTTKHNARDSKLPSAGLNKHQDLRKMAFALATLAARSNDRAMPVTVGRHPPGVPRRSVPLRSSTINDFRMASFAMVRLQFAHASSFLPASVTSALVNRLVIGANLGILAQDFIHRRKHLPHSRLRDRAFDNDRKLGLELGSDVTRLKQGRKQSKAVSYFCNVLC